MRYLFLSIVAAAAGAVAGWWLGGLPPKPSAVQQASSPGTVPVSVAAPAKSVAPAPSAEQTPPAPVDLRKALDDADVFRGARQALTWIEHASLEDLRAFASDPKRFPRMYTAGLDDEFQRAFISAFVERWLTLAPQDFALIEKMPRFESAAAQVKPELVLARIFADGKKSPLENLAESAFQSLGEHDVRTARALLENIEDEKKRHQCECALIRGLAASDPFAALAQLPKDQSRPDQPDYLRGQALAAIAVAGEQMGPGALRNLFTDAHGELDDYTGLTPLLLKYPDLAGDLAARNAPARTYDTRMGSYQMVDPNLLLEADRTPEAARARLLDGYDKLPAAGREELSAALACAWASTDPRAAADWAAAHGQPGDASAAANTAAKYVLIRWVNADPEAAAAWWEQLPPSAMRDGLGMELSTRYAESGDFDEALKMFRPVAGKSFESATTQFAQLYSQRDPVAAADWLAQLPPGTANENAIRPVVKRFYQTDADSAAAWAEALPPGNMHDLALKGVIQQAMQMDPAGAAEWVGQIADPHQRTQAAQSVAYRWRRQDPSAAREWVRTQPGLDENFRATFLRQ